MILLMITLVIPFHSDYYRLRTTLPRIRSEASQFQIKEVLLVHNGPQLSTRALQEIVSGLPDFARLLHTETQGIGAAYRLGLQSATQEYTLLSSSDLHFGFSDLSYFLSLDPKPKFALGSKSHPSSVVKRSILRQIATSLIAGYRRLILGSHIPKDTQGSCLVKTDLGQALLPRVRATGYIFPLELILRALEEKISIVEMPVTLEEEIYPSNVRLVRDGLRMLYDIFKLKFRN
jgi:hypothetical protein